VKILKGELYMLIKKIKINNFRSIKELNAVLKNNMLTIVGKNDVGKSNVLQALKVFFEEEKLTINDFPNYDTNEVIEIKIVFKTDKFEEIKYNGELKLKKVYKVNKNKILQNQYAFIIPDLPSEEDLNTYSDYKNIGKTLGVDFPKRKPKDNDKIDELKQKVINDINDKRGQADWIDINDNWKEIKDYFPDIVFVPASQDHDDEQKMTTSSVFGKIFRVGIKRWLKVDKESQGALKTINSKVEEINNNILKVVERKLKEQLPLANEISQDLSPLDITKGFDFTMMVNDPQGVKTPLNKRGNGLRRSVLIAAIRAQNEVNEIIEDLGKEDTDSEEDIEKYEVPTLYLFEEPEAFLHLAAQKELFYSLKDLTKHNSQIIITSHSTLFIDQSEMEDIVLLSRNNGETKSLQHIPDRDIKDELGEIMRVSELITGKACCIVEGVSDRLAFQEWLKTMGSDPRKLGIHFVSMDGCTNAEYYANADILADFHVPFLLVLDFDTHKTRNPETIKRRLEEKYSFIKNKERIIILDGELENYYNIDIVANVLNIPKKYIDLEKYEEDPKEALEKAKTIAIKNEDKQVRAYNERRDSKKIASRMKKEDIDDDIKDILNELVNLVI
jgi:predicted ATP-dependent endonuclease of OLD family